MQACWEVKGIWKDALSENSITICRRLQKVLTKRLCDRPVLRSTAQDAAAPSFHLINNLLEKVKNEAYTQTDCVNCCISDRGLGTKILLFLCFFFVLFFQMPDYCSPVWVDNEGRAHVKLSELVTNFSQTQNRCCSSHGVICSKTVLSHSDRAHPMKTSRVHSQHRALNRTWYSLWCGTAVSVSLT